MCFPPSCPKCKWYFYHLTHCNGSDLFQKRAGATRLWAATTELPAKSQMEIYSLLGILRLAIPFLDYSQLFIIQKARWDFFDRKKQNKNKNQSIVQKATHSTSTPNVILLKEQKHLNHICGFHIMSNDHEQLQTPCNRPCLSYMLQVNFKLSIDCSKIHLVRQFAVFPLGGRIPCFAIISRCTWLKNRFPPSLKWGARNKFGRKRFDGSCLRL